MAAGVQFTIEESNHKKIVRLQGKIDAMSTPNLEKKLMPLIENEHKMSVDFSKVEYLSSAGMRLLLSATRKMKAKGGMIVFFGMNDEVSEIIKMAGFEKILNIYPNEAAALKSLS
ncbi:MAG TPA: STAS domain-containing protein [Rhabdochlamydiaceae bacterium]|nr:STAS domain-containing protein [Rhabdochlamydiaceae bacterium]